ISLSPHVKRAVDAVKAAGYDLVLLETSRIGQSATEIAASSNWSLYVMTPDHAATTPLATSERLDLADLVAINKSDKQGADDALRDVRKQWKRNHLRFADADADIPVHLTVASDFNDPGTNRFYKAFVAELGARGLELESTLDLPTEVTSKQH